LAGSISLAGSIGDVKVFALGQGSEDQSPFHPPWVVVFSPDCLTVEVSVAQPEAPH
jgi:hypothetical protein